MRDDPASVQWRGTIMVRHALAAAALALLCISGAQAVGRAEVRFVEPEKFTDAGFGVQERERTQQLLNSHFERLARSLPDGQVLRVDITDVDLAGEVDTLAFHRIRVIGQLPDAPRLDMRFELRQGDRVISRGEEKLSDLAYDFGRIGAQRGQPLQYEARMIDRWFSERFATQLAARK
jgi:hypothetical protein